MAFDAEQRRTALRDFLSQNKGVLNVNKWERKADLGEGTLRRFLKGDTQSLTDNTYVQLAEAASDLTKRIISINELQGEGGGQQPTARVERTGGTSPLTPVDIMRDQVVTTLLIWKLTHGASGQQGAFVLTSEALVDLPRPELIAEAKKPFRCKLLDNANAPGYAAGHTVVVDPSGGAVINDLCIFTDEKKVLAEGAPSVAAIFRGFTATHWIVTQNAVEGEQSLPRSTYPQAWPVVVHYPRGT